MVQLTTKTRLKPRWEDCLAFYTHLNVWESLFDNGRISTIMLVYSTPTIIMV